MIEVVQIGARWSWEMISASGRVMAYPLESWSSIQDAARAGQSYRAAIWARAEEIDHRQARAI